ncbi:MAG: 2Fe-2S iron-sulfur cluster binding domain-containing protein [Bacteroidetes bacterium]|nr:2Fe-2S iron-sulfur cluster binding domain-containing protein [Bacteroidota bacterium]MBS1756477.1 2Fe-2S iron-sulfur cluster binding domain-containing protein [Bacteroidota bacterium]
MTVTEKSPIIIKVLYDEEEHLLTTYTAEYRNLMMLIFDKIYVQNFGECGGMGRCATCLIEILKSEHTIPAFDRNEWSTIKKTGITDNNIRLACQIPVNELLHNATIQIRNDRGF